jgi:hypothetical protein
MEAVQEAKIEIKPFRRSIAEIKDLTVRKHLDESA